MMVPVGEASLDRGTLVTPSVALEAQLDLAASAGLRIAVAESLTGGLLADAFVSVAGASRVFSGGVVAYDTSLKHTVLDVDAALLKLRGPVDAEVARQMAFGVRRVCAVPREEHGEPISADIGLATTGVAGPEPDPATGQPVGTVWIGVSSRLGERSVRANASGDRQRIRTQTVVAVLRELAAELQSLGVERAARNQT